MSHGVSRIYSILTELEGVGIPPFIGKKGQGTGLEEQQIERMIREVYDYATDTKHFQFISIVFIRWYIMPERAQK